jgi:hypothetical protein
LVGLITDNLKKKCRTDGMGGGCTDVRGDSAVPSASFGNKEYAPANCRSPVWNVEDIATVIQSDYFLNCYDITIDGIVSSLLAGRFRVSNLDRGKNLSSKTSRLNLRPSQPSIQRIPNFFFGDRAAAA